jgi:UDP-N-acetyl-D-glucosamine dehydrogenase
VHQHMPYYCAERVARALNDHRKAVNGSTVLLLGVSYKGDVGDVRESPALKLIELLVDRGATVVYHDPHVPDLVAEGHNLVSSPLTDELLAGSDIACVVTAHSTIDYGRVAAQAPLVLDFRNVVPARERQVVTL